MGERFGVKHPVVCEDLVVQPEPVFVLVNFFLLIFGVDSRSWFVAGVTVYFVLILCLNSLLQPAVTLFLRHKQVFVDFVNVKAVCVCILHSRISL